MTSSGNFAPPCDTKYAGPVSGTGRIGVVALACPIREAVEQAAGLALNVLAGHAFCSVDRREGSCLGRSTLTFAMFVWVPCGVLGYVSFTDRLAPLRRVVLPEVETLKFGLNPRF